MTTQFQTAVEKILKAHGLFEKFQTQTDFHVCLEQESYEPLVIEQHGELISLAHYFEQGGDLIADPDVELHFPDWTPTAIQMSSGFYTQKIIQWDGETYVNMAFDPSVRPLLATWARNIQAQGWANPEEVKARE